MTRRYASLWKDRIVAVLLSASTLGCTWQAEDKKQLISLSTVWGYRIPGTNDIRNLEPISRGVNVETEEQLAAFKNSHVQQILSELSDVESPRGPFATFVVAGKREDALKDVYEVIVGGQDAGDEFHSGEQLYAVFYTSAIGAGIEIESIEYDDASITISYRFHQRWSDSISPKIALIPLPSMLPGEVLLQVVRLRPDMFGQGQASSDIQDRYESSVSHSSEFKLVQQERHNAATKKGSW